MRKIKPDKFLRKYWFVAIIALIVLAGTLFSSTRIYEQLECNKMNEKRCVRDDDCMCTTGPCFLGNKEYYNKCVVNKEGIGMACPDACGFGPYEWDFRTICENNECALAVFNRTSGERIR